MQSTVIIPFLSLPLSSRFPSHSHNKNDKRSRNTHRRPRTSTTLLPTACHCHTGLRSHHSVKALSGRCSANLRLRYAHGSTKTQAVSHYQAGSMSWTAVLTNDLRDWRSGRSALQVCRYASRHSLRILVDLDKNPNGSVCTYPSSGRSQTLISLRSSSRKFVCVPVLVALERLHFVAQ